jgi:predicted dehydrogenase
MRAVALYRRDARRRAEIAREFEIDAAASLEELVERPDVDALLISTPPAAHERELQLALDAGKPALVEKPVTECFESARRLCAACEGRSTPVMVAQTLRFNPALQRARVLVDALGRIHRVRTVQRLEPSELAWQKDRTVAGGGSITLTGVHLFDLLRWLLGRTPDTVSCRCFAVGEHPLENLFDAIFDYDAERILASAEVCKFGPARSARLELVGTEGQLEVDYLRGRIERIEGRRRVLLDEPGDVPTLPGTLAAFGRLVRGEIANPVPVLEGVETLRMAEGCYRSHRSGGRIRLDTLEAAA